ncbi:HNH endonuclease [Kineococcus rhizosphaerae]|uniref:HNH endonuclease n=1 Tax=Kineococcus rhizosphaerae TaxID=559628 RepID=UPI000D064B48
MTTSPTPRNGSTWAWRKLRARVLAKSDVCHLCGRPGADEVDHVIPIARGGALLDEANCRPAHRSCNRRKGAKLYVPAPRSSRSSRSTSPTRSSTAKDVGPSRDW